MSERTLTYIERWTLAIGSPVIAAGIIAVAGMLWGLYDSQMRMEHQLTALIEKAYTETQAERDFTDVRHDIDNLEARTDRLERRVIPSYQDNGDRRDGE